MDANCITLGDGSCAAPDPCMHTSPLTPDERRAILSAANSDGEWIPSVVNAHLFRYEATVRALEGRA